MVEHATINQIMDLLGKNRVRPANLRPSTSRPDSPEFGRGERKFVRFNISGQEFLVTQALLSKYPGSKLANADQLEKYKEEELNAYYFDRDPTLFNSILNIFRYNSISLPPGYTEFMMREELLFWNLSPTELADTIEECDACIEEDFLWMESRIPPPKEPISRLSKVRYNIWCFVTDPLGPHTKHRKLSITFAVITIILTILFMIVFGLSTNPSFRMRARKANQSELAGANITDTDIREAPTCDGDIKLMCFVESEPLPWIQDTLHALLAFFFFDTILRILVCPDLKIYLKSVINWTDIFCCLCVIAIIPFSIKVKTTEAPSKEWVLILIVLKGLQVFRIFKVLQVCFVCSSLSICAGC